LTLNNRDLEIWVIGHWRSSKVVPFYGMRHRSYCRGRTTSACCYC